MKKNLVALSLVMGLAAVSCGDSKNKEESKTDQSTTKPADKGDANSDKSDSTTENKGEENTNTTTDPLARTYLAELDINVGDACDIKKDLYACSKNKGLFYCSQDVTTKESSWQFGAECDANEVCAAWKYPDLYLTPAGGANCFKPCDPASFSPEADCEWSEEYKVAEREFAICENINGAYLEIYGLEACGGCGANNQCLTTDDQKGKNAKVGDACLPYVFENRCDGKKAINCHISGKVIATECSSACTLKVVAPEDYIQAFCLETESCADIDENATYQTYYYESTDKCVFFRNYKQCWDNYVISGIGTDGMLESFDLDSGSCQENYEDYCEDNECETIDSLAYIQF